MEKKDDQGGKCNDCGNGKDNGGSWSEITLWRQIDKIGDEVTDKKREWKPTWQEKKTCLQKAMESRRIENYKTKEQQSQFYQ